MTSAPNVGNYSSISLTPIPSQAVIYHGCPQEPTYLDQRHLSRNAAAGAVFAGKSRWRFPWKTQRRSWARPCISTLALAITNQLCNLYAHGQKTLTKRTSIVFHTAKSSQRTTRVTGLSTMKYLLATKNYISTPSQSLGSRTQKRLI